MRRDWITISISFIAIACNALLLCFLVFEIFRTPFSGYKPIVMAALGGFLLLNLTAIILATRGSYKDVKRELSSLPKQAKDQLIGYVVGFVVCIGIGFWLGFHWHNQITGQKGQYSKWAKFEKFMYKSAPYIVTQTLEGNQWKLQEQLGKVVLLHFWATSCRRCVADIEQMKKIYEKYKRYENFAMVGVCLDKDKNKVEKFCKDNKISWTQLFEGTSSKKNSIARAFQIRKIPSVWIIDKKGYVIGIDLDDQQTELIIEKSL